MAKAARQAPYLFVLEEDRALDSSLQTVFYIKLKTGHDSNLTTSRYAGTIAQTDRGFMNLDVAKSNNADIEEFCHVISKIENFDFGEQYYKDHPAMKEKAKKKKDLQGVEGLYVSEITEPSLLADVSRLLPNKQLREVLAAADDRSRLEDGLKK